MPLSKDLVAQGVWPAVAKVLGDDMLQVATTVAAGSTLTLTAAHADKVCLLDTAAGSTVTLPAATGTGNTFYFRVSTSVTSNNHVVKVANATDVMRGGLMLSGGTGGIFCPLATGDTITMNGTTTGGLIGTEFSVTDTAAGFFTVSGFVTGSGTVATVFGATVS